MDGKKKDIPVTKSTLKTRVGRVVLPLLESQSLTTKTQLNNIPTRVAASGKSKGDMQ
jgi:hypothetical protein